MSFGQWFRYVFRDPWDFADPEKVAGWPEECRDTDTRRMAETNEDLARGVARVAGPKASPKTPLPILHQETLMTQDNLKPCPFCGSADISHGAEPSPSVPLVSAASGFDPSRMDDTDWHVLAQDISNYWATPDERAIAYQAAGEAIRLLRGEIRRQGDDRCPL